MSVYSNLAKKASSKERRMYPEAMEVGKKYIISSVTTEVSKFQNSSGEYPRKLVVHLEHNGFKFYLYMGVGYDDCNANVVTKIKDDIAAGKAGSIVMYGKIGTTNELYILGADEEVSETKLAEVTNMASAEARSKKRQHPDDEEFSPSKKFR